MAAIPGSLMTAALVQGGTWGSAADAAAGSPKAGRKFHVSSVSINSSFGSSTTADNGYDNFLTALTQQELTVEVSITCELTIANIWPQALYSFMCGGGVTQTPAENNTGEGDYLHVGTMTSSVAGEFLTFAHKLEDDKAMEIPSLKITGITTGMTVNRVPTITFTGIGDKVVYPAVTNTHTKIDTLDADPTYRVAYGAANHYFRLATRSTSTELDSGDDLQITAWNMSMQRAYDRGFVLRGANSKYTLEPLQIGPITGTLSFTLLSYDDAVKDIMADWLANTAMMASCYMDGTQIGAGDNRSLQFLWNKLQPTGPIPSPNGPSGNGRVSPTMQYTILDVDTDTETATAGMTTTKAMRVEVVTERSAKYHA